MNRKAAARILAALGVVLGLCGLLWIGQGSGRFPYPASSFMIDESIWVYRGAWTGLAGLVLLVAALLVTRRSA